jgi:hypothetical protein
MLPDRDSRSPQGGFNEIFLWIAGGYFFGLVLVCLFGYTGLGPIALFCPGFFANIALGCGGVQCRRGSASFLAGIFLAPFLMLTTMALGLATYTPGHSDSTSTPLFGGQVNPSGLLIIYALVAGWALSLVGWAIGYYMAFRRSPYV